MNYTNWKIDRYVTADTVPPADSVPPPGHYPLADSVPFDYIFADSVPPIGSERKCL